MSSRRHERPLKRVNPSGRVVWVARWRDKYGKTRSAGTFELQGACRTPDGAGECCAQHAIDRAYDMENVVVTGRDTVGVYAARWLGRHPRSKRTADGYEVKLRALLDVPVEGRPLKDWPLGDVRRRHVTDLVEVLLVDQGRAAKGAAGVLRAYSAMFSNAMQDEWVETNPWKGVRINANDPRIVKAPRAPVVWTWAQSRPFAAAAGAARCSSPEINAWRPVYAELMLLVLSDCGLRIGEMLPLHRGDVHEGMLRVERTVHNGIVQAGTKTDHGQAAPGRWVPLAPALEQRLRGLPPVVGMPWLFPTPAGGVWGRDFYDDVLGPARAATGMHVLPHDLRHSYVSQMAAAGVDEAVLAGWTGHTVATMNAHYRHAIVNPDTFEAGRRIVGA